ncbi:MAG: tetratricopeptide repeat protein [Paenisporosarcina sp.]
MENKRKKPIKENIVSFIPTGEYYYQKALQALNKEQFEKAHKYLNRAAELSPDDPLILMQLAIVEMEMENYDLALDLLQSAHSLDPNESEIIFFLAEVNAHLGLIVDARKYAKKYTEMDVSGVYAEEAMEIIDFTDQEDWPLFEDDSFDSDVLYIQEKARRMMEQGDFEKAVEVLEKLLEENPEFWAAYNNLALAYFYIGEVDQAKALLHHVLEENTGNLHALCNLAVVHYYEKNDEELDYLLKMLSKIQPYLVEHRYKLGATFALVGRYEEAFKWLRSLQKKGYEGDPGFYFWLSHSAYFSGNEDIARQTWKLLIKLDPDKDGLEPWSGQKQGDPLLGMEHSRDFIVEKLESVYRSERMIGLYLLGKTSHKQEIISHPEWVKVESYSTMEKQFLAHSLGHEFEVKDTSERNFMRAVEATELIYQKHKPLTSSGSFLFQMWFVLIERAIDKGYTFKNPKALAGSADYMFQSSREQGITKKAIAEDYNVTPATLTKYVNELIQFLPLFDS